LHAGWHDSDSTTTPAREAMAGLRIGAINAHQKVIGTEFIFAPADPQAYNLLVKHLAGVTPVCAWNSPLLDADYSDLGAPLASITVAPFTEFYFLSVISDRPGFGWLENVEVTRVFLSIVFR
jgi:hypothetical protein